jgi:hypothetical protein
MDVPAAATPVVCDMSAATDTPEERLAEYRRLFRHALAGKERTAEGIRFRFRAEPGVEPWVRDLAAREKACCSFFAFAVTAAGDEVPWDAAVIDDDVARAVLEEFYLLPETAAASPGELHERLARRGLRVTGEAGGQQPPPGRIVG